MYFVMHILGDITRGDDFNREIGRSLAKPARKVSFREPPTRDKRNIGYSYDVGATMKDVAKTIREGHAEIALFGICENQAVDKRRDYAVQDTSSGRFDQLPSHQFELLTGDFRHRRELLRRYRLLRDHCVTPFAHTGDRKGSPVPLFPQGEISRPSLPVATGSGG